MNYKSCNKIETDGRIIQSQLLAGMLANPWWMQYAQEEAKKGGRGSVQEILIKASHEYASKIIYPST